MRKKEGNAGMGTTAYEVTGFFILPRLTFKSNRDKLLFYDLVQQANYRDETECKRGQHITSALKIAKDNDWTVDQVRTSLKRLAADGLIQIETFKDRKKGIRITISGYNDMQKLDTYKPKNPELNPEYNPEYNPELTPNKNVDVSRVEGESKHYNPELNPEYNPEYNPDSLTTYKQQYKQQDKHIKDIRPNRKKRVYDESTDEYILAKYLRDKILAWKPNAKVPVESINGLSSWADTMRLMLEIDKRDKRQVARVINWATSDDFWQTVILSAATLRKQFDKLEALMIKEDRRHGQTVIPLRGRQRHDFSEYASLPY